MNLYSKEIREALYNDLKIRRKCWGNHPGIMQENGRIVLGVPPHWKYTLDAVELYADDWEVINNAK